MCAHGFYLYNDSECHLLCDAWVKRDTTYTLIETVASIMTTIFCVCSCVILAIIAFTIRKHEM